MDGFKEMNLIGYMKVMLRYFWPSLYKILTVISISLLFLYLCPGSKGLGVTYPYLMYLVAVRDGIGVQL